MSQTSAPPASSSEVQAQIHYKLIESLSESERRYRALVERLRDPVLQCTLDGRLEYLNGAWAILPLSVRMNWGKGRENGTGRRLGALKLLLQRPWRLAGTSCWVDRGLCEGRGACQYGQHDETDGKADRTLTRGRNVTGRRRFASGCRPRP